MRDRARNAVRSPGPSGTWAVGKDWGSAARVADALVVEAAAAARPNVRLGCRHAANRDRDTSTDHLQQTKTPRSL
eukprot:gene14806-biopygen1522